MELNNARAHNAMLYYTLEYNQLFVARRLFATYETVRCIPGRNMIPVSAEAQV